MFRGMDTKKSCGILVWLKHTLSETKNLVCKFFVDSISQDIGLLNTV